VPRISQRFAVNWAIEVLRSRSNASSWPERNGFAKHGHSQGGPSASLQRRVDVPIVITPFWQVTQR